MKINANVALHVCSSLLKHFKMKSSQVRIKNSCSSLEKLSRPKIASIVKIISSCGMRAFSKVKHETFF